MGMYLVQKFDLKSKNYEEILVKNKNLLLINYE